MIAAFVHHGALDATLLYDTCQEMYFQYAKIQPYLADFRRHMNLPEWLISVERLVEGSKPDAHAWRRCNRTCQPRRRHAHKRKRRMLSNVQL